MKTYKEIIGEAKASGESPRRDKEFKDKHIIQKINHPVAGDDQFAAPKIKKDKTKHASHHDGEDAAVYEAVEIRMEEVELHEDAMSDDEMKKREDIVKGMKKNKADFQKRYGDRWKSVMYATATKAAMKESVEQIDELSKSTMGSYIGKASADMRKKKDQVSKGSLSMTDLRKGQKRNTMITKAQDKAHAMESVDLDETFKAGSMKLKDGTSVTVSEEQASTLNALFNELNSSNQKKMQERLMSNSNNFKEILAFAKEVV